MWQSPRPFRDRQHAGQVLAAELKSYRGQPDLSVLALPRGGVPVGFEVAIAVNAELDVFLVRKLGVPGHEELAMGAIASGGTRIVNEEVRGMLGISAEVIDRVAAIEIEELRRRERLYRGDRPPTRVEGRTVFLVDDGLATGSTMRAAAAALRDRRPQRLIIAVPVAPRDTCEALRELADDVCCVLTPASFSAVGQWYEDFSQTSDEEVQRLLRQSAEGARQPHAGNPH